jgi:hypothetical protein
MAAVPSLTSARDRFGTKRPVRLAGADERADRDADRDQVQRTLRQAPASVRKFQ